MFALIRSCDGFASRVPLDFIVREMCIAHHARHPDEHQSAGRERDRVRYPDASPDRREDGDRCEQA